MTATEKIEMALALSKDIMGLESALEFKRDQLAKLFDGESNMVSAILDERHDAPMPQATVDAAEIPVSTRLRALLESAPGKRFNLFEIRQRLGNPSPLALRKALYRLSHEVRGFARDKRARGVYYYRGV